MPPQTTLEDRQNLPPTHRGRLVALLSRTSRYHTCPFVSQHLEAVVHYATTRVIPQQTLAEITVTLDVLRSLAPCDFLVFGLGHDSLMWASLNPGGTTLFLEEEPNWIIKVLNDAPGLRAEAVAYRTQVSEAAQLLSRHYRDEPSCWAQNSFLRGNNKCSIKTRLGGGRVEQVSVEHAVGVGRDHDRRAAGILPGGAGEDGGHILGSRDSEAEEEGGAHACVCARRGPTG
ncbi:Protein of unknown function (DUF579 [Striga hermonthica]|uniref:Uncharacterized protein n=1 Tax=Striga hermonthica TaxID=68872 RepID=A0A9N7NPY4_STRHE|nr:Protein of unknown function (DUF579 [Striga hermonthica]